MSIDFYKDKDIQNMTLKFYELDEQHRSMVKNLAPLQLSTEKGNEFKNNGFLRRCNILWRCIENIFTTIPPELAMIPSKEQVDDSAIFVQCFIIHVFGACDNLAWILVYEKNILKDSGSPLPPSWVGLRKKNKIVRKHLSDKINNILDHYDNWFNHVDNYRDALAHRIPLYVPEPSMSPDREQEYNDIEGRRLQALLREDLAEEKRLEKEQNSLLFFKPLFTHSFSERSPLMVIHPQMLQDFGAVLELGETTFQDIFRGS